MVKSTHAIDAATPDALNAGVRMFQAFLLHEDEAEHAGRLLALMQPKLGAVVVDAGCGVGELALQMNRHRTDLKFILINLSAAQLLHCPATMEQHCADFTAMPLADNSVDVVLYSYAAVQCDDLDRVLREARRVLRDDGVVFIYDVVNTGQCNTEAWRAIGGHIRSAPDYAQSATHAGFALDAGHFLTPAVDQLRMLVSDDAAYAKLARGIEQASFRFRKMPDADPIADAFARHERIGFQFSGGRDSTAALYLLRPYWHLMTVYHLDTGDQFPETRDVVDQVAREVPILRIQTSAARVREEFGLPSDVVPVDNSELGRKVSGRGVKLQSRYDCCWRTLMQPMHQRMQDDGITLLVRGQRDDEYAEPPLRSGGVANGFEVLYPIQDWTGEQVSKYLVGNGLPIAPFYARGMRRAPECMGCTAWWDEGRGAYMKAYHPRAHSEFVKCIAIVRAEIKHQTDELTQDLGE